MEHLEVSEEIQPPTDEDYVLQECEPGTCFIIME
jgi:hypothetical protein